MGHGIEIAQDGKANFFAAIDPAWHRLGTVFDDFRTADQAIDDARLGGWDVRLARTIAIEEYVVNSAEVALLGATPVTASRWVESEKFSTIRNNPVTGGINELGSGRGEGYTVVQNEELAYFLDALVGGGARIAAAGSLYNGKQVFFCCDLGTDVWVGGQDQIKTYLTLMNSHDGSSSVRAIAAPIRVVCRNTQEAAIASALSSWSHRHTKGVTASVAAAQHDLELTFAYEAEFAAEAERLLNTPMTLGEFDTALTSVFGNPAEDKLGKRGVTIRTNKIEAARAIWVNGGPTMDSIAGTRWAGYQAITQFIDHGWGKDGDARALRAVNGEGRKVRQEAFDLLHVPA